MEKGEEDAHPRLPASILTGTLRTQEEFSCHIACHLHFLWSTCQSFVLFAQPSWLGWFPSSIKQLQLSDILPPLLSIVPYVISVFGYPTDPCLLI